ncbi:MAG TPA: DUF2147 domain-containing protein [Pseudolabrys sp.]|nr:DUF2147 domain-containing protein [Pseudolabrys sp.]
MKKSVTAAACGLAALLLSGAAQAASPAAPYGVWTSQERDVRVRLHDCNGKICGTLVWLQQETDPKTGQPKTDKLNPDPAKRTRPLIGIQVAQGFAPAGARRWTGTIYNADDGHTYRAHLIVRDPRTIRLEGCMLVVLCMGHTWHRVGGIAQTAGAPEAGHRFDLSALLGGRP